MFLNENFRVVIFGEYMNNIIKLLKHSKHRNDILQVNSYKCGFFTLNCE